MRAKRWPSAIGKILASKRPERERQEGGARREAELRMSALRAGNWRRLLLQGAGAVVLVLAANLAWADAPLSAGPAPTDRGATGLLAEPKFDLAPAGQIAPREDAVAPSASPGPAAPDNSPAVYDPTAGPTLSPMQSALRAATERLATRADRVNPLGSGDWRAARWAIAAFYAARFYAPIWVGEDGLTEAGRSALSQLERALPRMASTSRSSRRRARSAPALLPIRSPRPRPQSLPRL